MTYFDPIVGWVAPSDTHETDTTLKEVIAALKGSAPSNDLCDAVERLLYKYQIFVLHGVREPFGKQHKDVTWHLVVKDASDDKRALISYQDGMHGEWHDECYADEVPEWLLKGLFRRISRRKPLGDQEADETIAAVDAAYAEHVRTKLTREAVRNVRLLSTFRV